MKDLFKSFGYAFRGIGYTVMHERNFRIHICIITFLFPFLLLTDFFEVTRTQYAILVLYSALVLALELINTALEKAVDLACKGERHNLAKIAKDACAGAVLIAAIGAVILAGVLFCKTEALLAIYEHYKAHPVEILWYIAKLIADYIFVFIAPKKIAGFISKRSKK